jgi:hypothetical protein
MLHLLGFRFIYDFNFYLRKSLNLGKLCFSLMIVGLVMSFQIKAQVGSVVDYTAPVSDQGPASTFTVPITFDDHGYGLLSFQFNILYDPTIINPSGTNFGCSTTGTIPGAVGTSVLCNVVAGDEGRLRLSSLGFSTFSTGVDGSGPGPLVNLTFTSEPTAVGGDFSPLTFESDFFFNNLGPIETQNPTNGQINILSPTAAEVNVSGRVSTNSGRGIRRAIMTISDSLGNQRSTMTNQFGYYNFEVLAGDTYTISIFSKGHTFKQNVRVLTVSDAVANIDFVAVE